MLLFWAILVSGFALGVAVTSLAYTVLVIHPPVKHLADVTRSFKRITSQNG